MTINLPDQMDDHLLFILGRPNFACGEIAQILRVRGHSIPHKAEDEQAATIFWMLGHYHRAGANWRAAASDELKLWQAEAKQADRSTDSSRDEMQR